MDKRQPSLGALAIEKLGATVGEQVAIFLLRNDCKRLSCCLEEIDVNNFLNLVGLLEAQLIKFIGQDASKEITDSLKLKALAYL